MSIKHILLMSTTIVLSAACMTSAAFAFCGNVQASASGATREEAISIANNKGLQETRRLDRNYGGNVHYNPASLNCQQSHVGVYCTITQKFCADSGAQTRPARGEEGGGSHGCPPGTRPVPETDNCVSVRSGEFQPWKKPGCGSLKQRCNRGDVQACGKYESTCQVN